MKIFEQIEDKQFTEITAQLGLSSSIINESYSGVWKADFDLDGDLDLILARGSAPPRILQNNGDGTFSTTQKFADVGTPVHFTWADIDADGDADAIFLNESGELVVYANERVGEFSRITTLPDLPPVHSFEIVDLDSDSYLEIAALTSNTVERVYLTSNQGETGAETVANFEPSIADNSYKKLFVQDFDNNGGLDFIISGDSESHIWLSDEQLNVNPLDLQLPGQLYSTTDMTGNNRMDMIGLNEENVPYQLVNTGTMGYNGRMISPRASGTEGDQRINSFGIGGEIEIRSGVLYHKQPIDVSGCAFWIGHL
ncbi:MAG: FG-GAP-like repeat-containing protein [Balneolaceae bacterium]|nr:FG-GAP-like repeat-containing protein [Balneolaceae bacterium]